MTDISKNAELQQSCITAVMRPSFWFMTDSHLFIKPKGRNIYEILGDLHEIAKQNKYGMICPVILNDENGNEIKRIGEPCHVDYLGNFSTIEWFNEIMKYECVRLYDGA